MQAWHKAQKQKAIKKGKAEVLKARTEKLARRNPDRLQSQIDDLRALPSLGVGERKRLADLERDLAAVKKARTSLGIEEKERKHPRNDGERKHGDANKTPLGGGRDDGNESDASTTTTESVREIPLPPGPLPPLPGQEKEKEKEKPKPVTTYESAPVLRDLRKEAAAFVPTAVKRKLEMRQQQQQREKSVSAGAEEGAEGAEVGEGELEPEKGNERTPGRRTGSDEAAGTVAATGEGGGIALGVGMGLGMRINAAPEVDVDTELQRFQAEVEEVEDQER